jgi:hypothetical protein
MDVERPIKHLGVRVSLFKACFGELPEFVALREFIPGAGDLDPPGTGGTILDQFQCPAVMFEGALAQALTSSSKRFDSTANCRYFPHLKTKPPPSRSNGGLYRRPSV